MEESESAAARMEKAWPGHEVDFSGCTEVPSPEAPEIPEDTAPPETP